MYKAVTNVGRKLLKSALYGPEDAQIYCNARNCGKPIDEDWIVRVIFDYGGKTARSYHEGECCMKSRRSSTNGDPMGVMKKEKVSRITRRRAIRMIRKGDMQQPTLEGKVKS